MFFVEYTSRIKVIQLSNMGQEWFLTHMPENSPFAPSSPFQWNGNR